MLRRDEVHRSRLVCCASAQLTRGVSLMTTQETGHSTHLGPRQAIVGMNRQQLSVPTLGQAAPVDVWYPDLRGHQQPSVQQLPDVRPMPCVPRHGTWSGNDTHRRNVPTYGFVSDSCPGERMLSTYDISTNLSNKYTTQKQTPVAK